MASDENRKDAQESNLSKYPVHPPPLPRPPAGLTRYQFPTFHSLSSLPRPFKSFSRLPTPNYSLQRHASNASTLSGSSTSTIRQVYPSPHAPTLVKSSSSFYGQNMLEGQQKASVLLQRFSIDSAEDTFVPIGSEISSRAIKYSREQNERLPKVGEELEGYSSSNAKAPRPGTPDPRSFIPRSQTMGDLAGTFGAYRRKIELGYASASQHTTSPEPETSPLKAVRSRRHLNAAHKPLPKFTTNIRQIHDAQPHAYWAGRFTALYDRFRTEDLLNRPADHRSSGVGGKAGDKHKENSRQQQPEMNDRRIRRVFIHLQSLCMDNTAKESLKSFQMDYAKMNDCNAALPSKDVMEKVGGAWEKVKGIGRRKTSSYLAGS